MERSFSAAFVLAFVVAVSPVVAFTARLQAIGEIALLPDGLQTYALHGRLSKESDAAFKLEQVRLRRPQVLALGSSRVLGLRESFFAKCEGSGCFYNAGGEKPTLKSGLEFFRAATGEAGPRLLLLGLDLWDFIPRYVPNDAPGKHDFRVHERSGYARIQDTLGVVALMLSYVRDDPRILDIVLGRTPQRIGTVGIAPTLLGSGYRPDGSFDWGVERYRRAAEVPGSTRVAPLVADIRGLNRPFLAFDEPDAVTLAEVDELVALARSRGAQVVVYFPPLPASAFEAIRADPALSAGVDATIAALRVRISGPDAVFVPIVSASETGCGDDEYWDPLHPSDVCDVRTLLTLMRQRGAREILANFVDEGLLAQLLRDARDPLRLDGPR